ncbi:MAG TPA: thiopurine S-methyltransferase [Candidatus Poseidoniales archaeon]|nr:MAG TPA: thiopurine S-methyltransferase [Candidatus Poseidoniales archaeon]HII26993.1 thiopurine S-methyltransferase [Poseidonia sp.]|tara:strand:- start:1682 stop:2323 length:642 start_codon:yes stop_codon:yes gene_type:complete
MTFWHNRWKTQQIGWHRAAYNDLLTKHWDSIGAPDGGEILVPLCGKSLDMLWLADRGYSVSGLEMVEEAIEAFVSENRLDVKSERVGDHIKHSSHPFTVHQGDFFELPEGTVLADAWYDRAAMIAVPIESRTAYVDQIRKLTKPDAVGLLITFAYPQEEMDGPPFALHDDHVMALFSDGFDVESLEHLDLGDEKDRGLSSVTSTVFRISRRSD